MINAKQYLFILGAGTSIPYDFSSGTGLVQSILENSQKGGLIHKYLTQYYGYDPETLRMFNKALAMSGQMSIDSFLEHREDLREIGKTIITIEIAYREYKSKLYEGFREDSGNSLYHYLYRNMNAELNDFKSNKVAFVTFNYDRSLEYFLCYALMYTHKIKYAKIAQVLESIPIIHVHGKIGLLAWEVTGSYNRIYENTYGTNIISKNSDRDIQNLETISNKINIVSDGQPEEKLTGEIQQQLQKADEVIFLGFGYDEENLNKLGILDSEFMEYTAVKRIIGTTKGLTGREIDEKEGILKRSGKNVVLDREGLSSLEFLRKKVSLRKVH